VSRSTSTASARPALLVRSLVAELGQRARSSSREARGPLAQLVGVGVLQGVLVLRARGAGVDLEVLHGLEIDRDALDGVREPRLEPAMTVGARRRARGASA
jgi:hypothetical protein